ncbi:hypothetical protein QUA46_05855 [Microcoleus sp. MON2_D6]
MGLVTDSWELAIGNRGLQPIIGDYLWAIGRSPATHHLLQRG